MSQLYNRNSSGIRTSRWCFQPIFARHMSRTAFSIVTLTINLGAEGLSFVVPNLNPLNPHHEANIHARSPVGLVLRQFHGGSLQRKSPFWVDKYITSTTCLYNSRQRFTKRAEDDHTVYAECECALFLLAGLTTYPAPQIVEVRTEEGHVLVARNMSPAQAASLIPRCCATREG